jgi:hypothetical protein
VSVIPQVVTRIENTAVNDSPGATWRSPSPLRNAFVGAVMGSKQMNALPGDAKTWAAG